MKDSTWYVGIGGGVVALGVGASLLTNTITGLRADRDHYAALAARPRPTATVTQVVPTARATSPPAISTPQPRPSTTTVGQRDATHPQTSGVSTGGRAASSGGVAAEQAPPNPDRTEAPSSSCSGRVVDVRLAVLSRCAITVGGR